MIGLFNTEFTCLLDVPANDGMSRQFQATPPLRVSYVALLKVAEFN